MTSKLKKRIPVSEETWKNLGRMKEGGQTYDDLLNEMIQERKRKELQSKMKKTEEMDEKELVSLDEL